MSNFADVFTMATTWQFQLLMADGETWAWYSQAEYTSEQACREAACRVYGGGMRYRLIRHDRTIVE